MSDEIHGGGPCARCGHNPACGWSQINDDWFCHADDHSCYSQQNWDGAFTASLSGVSTEEGQP